MRTSDRVGLGIAPLFLRVMLGGLFLWAGLAKLLTSVPMEPAQLAVLANMGVSIPQPPGPPLGRPYSRAADATAPVARVLGVQTPEPASTSPPPPPPVGAPGATGTQSTQRVYTAGDFAAPVPMKQLYFVALALHEAAQATPPVVPASAGRGSVAVLLAWACAITEAGAGALLLVGFFTRLSSLALAWVMLVALWMTTIGPAVLSGKTMWGFLPQAPGGWSDMQVYIHFWIQFSLLMSALALLCLGAGPVSIDAAMAAGPRPAPKPAPAK